jgi:hypothetical protein
MDSIPAKDIIFLVTLFISGDSIVIQERCLGRVGFLIYYKIDAVHPAFILELGNKSCMGQKAKMLVVLCSHIGFLLPRIIFAYDNSAYMVGQAIAYNIGGNLVHGIIHIIGAILVNMFQSF